MMALDESEEQRIAQWYNSLSNSYDQLYGQEQANKHRAVIEFIRNERFKILVDLGCGSGMLLQNASRFYEHAVGIDLSIGMLRAAKKKGSGATDLIQASLRTLPIKNNAADCLISISTLKVDSKLPLFLDEMKRICNQHSLMAVSLFHQAYEQLPLFLSGFAGSSKISHRETVYFFKFNG